MRNLIVLMSATALAACSGGGAQTAGSVANAGGSGATGSSSTATSDAYAQFTSPTVAKTYSGVGASQVFSYLTDSRGIPNFRGQQGSTFAGSASTVRDSKIALTYDPRDATFTLSVNDPNSGAVTATRFQDPASRTDFSGAKQPQWGVQDFSDSTIRFLQAGDGNPLSPYSQSGTGTVYEGTNTISPDGASGSAYQSTTLFYQAPGSVTKYVGFAGYVRNALSWNDAAVDTDGDPSTPAVVVHTANWHLERGAFAYGVLTDNNSVPKTGTGTYTGGMVASMVYNPTIDGAYGASLPTYFQWIKGSATTSVNFATSAVTLALSGTVYQPFYDRNSSPQTSTVPSGASFTAAGTGTINLVNTGGFTGQFQSASVGSTTNGAPTAIAIAGSSLDGAFYGPAANEVGGGFRIVGGTPDQRIDIAGAFTGKGN